MKRMCKCDLCRKTLNFTNSVIIKIDRFDDMGVHCKSVILCCNCWDSMKIMKDGKEIF